MKSRTKVFIGVLILLAAKQLDTIVGPVLESLVLIILIVYGILILRDSFEVKRIK
ncbi:MAG: hypothetical protein ABH851_03020 [Methanobacteriota archaeon]